MKPHDHLPVKVTWRYIAFFTVMFIACWLLFISIEPKYLDGHICKHPVDSHFFKTGKWLDTTYFLDAKRAGYNTNKYLEYFLPLDLVFPVVYSMLFLSIGNLIPKTRWYFLLFFTIAIGMILDYTENFSFASFLTSASNRGVALVTFISSLKSVFFGFNAIFCLGVLAWYVSSRLIRK